jgi:hypothetical protein
MTKFLFTLNMPSSQGSVEDSGRWSKLVHQVIGEHPAPTLAALKQIMDQDDYIVVTQMYKTPKRDENGKMVWETRDDVIINMQHVGKVQKYEDRSNQYDTYRGYAETKYR